MIFTVTVNPALDYVLETEAFAFGETNRASAAELCVGGKGINVSLVLAQLGVESVAMGFVAGFVGRELENRLAQLGLQTDFVTLAEGDTRINVKLKHEVVTELNAPGPAIPSDGVAALLEKVACLTDGDTLVLSGSLPPSAPADLYEQILVALSGRKVQVVVDTAGETLMRLLSYKPYLIKPNRSELEQLAGTALPTIEAVAIAARGLQQAGAENVLVSLGADGALLLTDSGQVLVRPAVGGEPVNTVGAGDSMVAGFLAGLERGTAFALDLAVAAGGATACSEGLATGEAIHRLLCE